MILEMPATRLTLSSSKFVAPGANVDLHCESQGYPVPNTTWTWQRCVSFGCLATEDAWQPVDATFDTLTLTLVSCDLHCGIVICVS